MSKKRLLSRYTLTVDLDAVAHNWRYLSNLCAPAACSAVVKADAYGLGAVQVVERLYREGCRDFMVATLAEALDLRAGLSFTPNIYVLSGIFPGEERICIENNIIPTLVSVEMFDRWLVAAEESGATAVLKVDTGMGRMGLSESELAALVGRKGVLDRAGITLVISHMACADTPEHPLNQQQLTRFQNVREKLKADYPNLKYSLANSAACLLGEDFHFDMVRPGLALYGVYPSASREADLQATFTLSLSIVQLNQLQKGESAGYGATFVADKETCLAVVAGGYADGIFRALGESSHVFIDGRRAPIVGRVSMDSILVDLSGFGLEQKSMEDWPRVELIGPHQTVERLSEESGVFCYEILTSLGQRFERVYLGGNVGENAGELIEGRVEERLEERAE